MTDVLWMLEGALVLRTIQSLRQMRREDREEIEREESWSSILEACRD